MVRDHGLNLGPQVVGVGPISLSLGASQPHTCDLQFGFPSFLPPETFLHNECCKIMLSWIDMQAPMDDESEGPLA